MKKQIQTHSFRFRRFTNKAYAAFRSLRLVVNIGCVAGYIADLQMRKSKDARLLSLTVRKLINDAAEAYATDESDWGADAVLCPALSQFTVVTTPKIPAACGSFTHFKYSLPDRLSSLSGFFIFIT